MSSADVDQVTSALAATSVDPKKDESASTIAVAEGRRLYIGNLDYTTNEDNLKEFFKGYKVESVSIPINPRTARAVGYAFVDVATKEEADKAIDDLSGMELLERKVSVQVARKPGTGPIQINGEPVAEGDKRGGRRGGRGGGGAPRGGRGGRGGRFSRRRSDSTRAAGEAPAAVAASTAATTAPAADATTEPAKTDGTPASPDDDKSGFKARRKRGPPENGVASTTKVMVANLPYEMTETSLKDIFSAYNPESAKIALRPIPRFMVRKLLARGEPRKGRGFGFVTLPTEEAQKKAVAEMNGKIIEGREIAVKVAIDNPKEDEDEAGEGTGGAGGAEGAEGDAAAAPAAPAVAAPDVPAATTNTRA